MKDELNGEIIEEFVSLKEKMYSLKTRKEEMKKAKGVKKNVVKKDIVIKIVYSKKENLCIPCRLYDHLNSTPSNRIKSPLSLTMINDTWWMMGLALYHTDILVCSKYLGNLSIIFSETFVIYFNF